MGILSLKSFRQRFFLILGGEKCGTTSLYYYLGQHPQIFFSQPKEPIFFEAEFEKGYSYYWSQYFAKWSGEHLVGEARHRNLYLPYVADRIKEMFTQPKLIIILRHPVERAFSHWLNRHIFLPELEPLSFTDAVTEDLKRIRDGVIFEGTQGPLLWTKSLSRSTSKKGVAISRYRTYIDSGYYYQQIYRYLCRFPEDNVKIVFLEDLEVDALKVVRELCDFLGLEHYDAIQSLEPQNVSIRKKEIRQFTMGYFAGIIRFLPNPLKEFIQNIFVDSHKFTMNRITRELLLEHYYSHNSLLEGLTGRNLSHWNK